MAKLSEEQEKTLAELMALKDKPDEPEASRSRSDNLNFTIDLSDEAAVDRAISLGLITREEAEDLDPAADDPPADPAPKRKLDNRYE